MNCGYSTNEKVIYLDGRVLCSFSYDKKQEKYICKHEHSSYTKGYKFLYADSPDGLCKQIEKTCKK